MSWLHEISQSLKLPAKPCFGTIKIMMNNKKTSTKAKKSASYWTSRVNKLALGRSVNVPGFGCVTNYRAADEVYGARRFKISGSKIVSNGANLPLAKVTARICSVIG